MTVLLITTVLLQLGIVFSLRREIVAIRTLLWRAEGRDIVRLREEARAAGYATQRRFAKEASEVLRRHG